MIDRDVPYKLRHVFDISDTNSRAGRNITLWQMKPEYEYAVSESLQASFGDVEEPRDFPRLLIDISGYAVEDNLSDYLMELNAVKAGSFLEELDDTSLEAWLKTTLKSSVAFMALSRAGYEPRQYFDREDFSHLFDFNTVEVISVLGAAVSDISEMVIREMGETIKEMEKEERRKIRTFAQEGASAYHKNRTENKERSNEHGTDLYDAGGLSDSRSDRAREPESWEVWNAAADIPPRAPGWDLHRDAAERNTEQSSGGGGPAGTEDAGRPDRADEGTERGDGAAEGRGSDVVGADDELHSPLGGGSDSERPDLRVTLPTVEQQQEIIAEAEEEKSSAFSISQEDIDAILTRGSGIHQGKFRIYEQFLKQDSSENNIAFLKNEYGIGGAYPAISGRNLDESHDAKGIKISRGRIATGDYDAVIIGHSQFEKIPMSLERQRAILQQQLDEVLDGISELKKNRGDNFSIKQLERTKKTVKQKLDKLNDQSRKDDVVTFEELGVDRIFIDEAHYYKNLAAFTKMRNVGGISQTEAMKSSDLYMKCRYLDQLTGGRGVVFATGTPISNSMVEMYTMQKYLQYGALRRNDLLHFDAWASTFGETVTAIELSPEGYTLIGR